MKIKLKTALRRGALAVITAVSVAIAISAGYEGPLGIEGAVLSILAGLAVGCVYLPMLERERRTILLLDTVRQCPHLIESVSRVPTGPGGTTICVLKLVGTPPVTVGRPAEARELHYELMGLKVFAARMNPRTQD